MEDWKKYKLGDLLTIKYGKDHKKLKEGNIPVYGSGGIMRRVNQSIYNGPSIMIPRKGSLNNVLYSNTPFWTVDTMFWSIINANIVNPLFLYYSLCKRDFASLNVGSAVPSLTVPILNDIDVNVPTLDTQNRIVNILKSLDNKIELNRRINDNLEQQAQALFNHYFIEHPDLLGNYSIGNLTDAANYLNGLAMQKFRPQVDECGIPVLKIKELGQGSTDSSSDMCSENIANEYKVYDGDIIFSWSGTLMVKIWCGGLCGLNQHLFKVTSDIYPKWFGTLMVRIWCGGLCGLNQHLFKVTSDIYPKWFYYFWTKYHLNKFIRIAQDKAVTMGHIKRGDLESSQILIPQMDVLSKLDAILNPLLKQIIRAMCESKKLSMARDTLLPQLMSGELKINDLNR